MCSYCIVVIPFWEFIVKKKKEAVNGSNQKIRFESCKKQLLHNFNLDEMSTTTHFRIVPHTQPYYSITKDIQNSIH